MRLRFSLRTLFLLMTVTAVLCLWFILPSLAARRFLAAVNGEDYQSADTFFRNSDDRFFADWADKRWSLRLYGELLPLTFAQFWRSQRTMRVEVSYFQFDQNLKCDVLITATPFGLTKPEFSSTQRLGIMYDGRGSETPAR